MKVVQLINGLGRGGGERLLVDLVRDAAAACRFSVYTLTRGGPLAEELESLGVPVRALRWRGLPLPWRIAALRRELAGADVLHTHFFWSDVAGVLLSSGSAVRLVSTRHETGYWMRAVHRAIERRVLPRFARVLCVSQAVRDGLAARGAPADLLSIAAPGVELPDGVVVGGPGPVRVVAVGRLERVKGHDLLVAALAELRREPRFGALELVLVGGGREREALERRAAELGVAGAVRFLGELPHEAALAQARSARIWVLPSRDEGLPVSLLEAMAAALPCVAARAGGVAEVVEHGRTGWLVDPESPTALANGIATLLDDPSRARAIGTAAREAVRVRWSRSAFVKRVLDAYGPAPGRNGSADVCLLVRNDFSVDGRVERTAQALAAAGRRALVIAEGSAGLPPSEERDGWAVTRLGVSAPRVLGGRLATLARTARFNLGALQRIFREVPAVVHANDLDTLFGAAVGAALVGARLVYDSHELWTERSHGLSGLARRLDRLKYGLLERLLIRRADAVLTVSDGIADELARRYGIDRPVVVRNVPAAAPGEPGGLRRAVGSDGPLLLHLGVVDRDRGLEQVVRALTLVPQARLVLLGPARAPVLVALRQLAEDLGVASRLVHLPPVPRAEILRWAGEADVGLCTFLPTSRSHVLALPNKLFEYALAGLPIVASDLPEMRRFVGQQRLGALCDPTEPRDVARAIRDVLERRVPLATAEEREALRREVSWEREREKLRAAYPGLDFASSRAQAASRR
jgi:glycosyltransferase involved in cell wall biosynthesis